ncbi:MAG: hypothetical protein H0W72_00155 [Planctomycetes bacterium]|nr:hypothetical protein [Planctomycetota bacterium]
MITRQGFTLFEVGISLLIMAIAVTSLLLLLPSGIQAQQATRFQLIAAGKALTIASTIVGPATIRQTSSYNEGGSLADSAAINATTFSPDLHVYANSIFDGIGIAVPTDIARRIDSDGDEIASVLDEGGSIFYPPTFGVAPMDGGTPTMEGISYADASIRRLVFAFRGLPQQNLLRHHPQIAWPYIQHQPGLGMPWERSVWAAEGIPFPPAPDYSTPAAIDATYLATSTVLAVDLGFVVPLAGVADPVLWETTNPGRPLAVACLALRNHAHASVIQASFGTATPAAESQARIDHEWMMRFLMFAKLERPDDCRTPRPGFHVLMTDVPLLAYDLFASPATSTAYPIRRSADPLWKCWPVLSERPVRLPSSWSSVQGSGAAASPPYSSWTGNNPITNQDPGHWNATAPFQPAERCRQLVVWAVDWMGYEDAEEVPSHHLDSSQLNYYPSPNGSAGFQHCLWSQRQAPEWNLVWLDAARISTVNWNPGLHMTTTTPMAYFGRYGADRNFNGTYDRGPLKKSVRLRAQTIARFNMYDPRGYVIAR